jgi:hypothetical protein
MTTKTKTDPVTEAEEYLAKSTQTLTDAEGHDRGLRERLLAGDTDVTAEMLAESGHAVEFARLGVEGAKVFLQGAQEKARRDRLAALTAEATALAGDPDAAIEAMKVIEEAVYGLVVADSARYQNLTRWIGTARREGVPQYEPNAKNRPDSKGRLPYRELSDEHGHVGWQEAGMGRPETFYAAGRKFTRNGNPGELIRAALERACRRAGGRSADFLDLNHKPHPRLIDTPEEWIRDNY